MEWHTYSQDDWPHSLLPAVGNGLIGAMLESSAFWRQWGKTGRLISAATTQAENQGYDLAHHNIHFIYEMLGHEKELNQKIHSCMIFVTQGKDGISKRSLNENLGLRV